MSMQTTSEAKQFLEFGSTQTQAQTQAPAQTQQAQQIQQTPSAQASEKEEKAFLADSDSAL